MKDLIVVGSGPAGAMTAKAAAERDLDVLLLDKQDFPRDKACGGAFSAKIYNVLKEDELPTKEVKKIHGLHVISPSLKIQARYGEDMDRGFYIPRTVFDDHLRKLAIKAGAEFQKMYVKDAAYTQNGVEVKNGKETYEGRLLVIADGPVSRLPEKFGFEQMYSPNNTALCINAETPVPDDVLDEHFGEKRYNSVFLGFVQTGYGWVFPKKGALNIGLGCTKKQLKEKPSKLYKDFVDLVIKFFGLKDFESVEPKGCLIPFSRTMKKTYTNRVMVAGDAAYMVSPVSGEGMVFGMMAGIAAAKTAEEALSDGDTSEVFLKRYQDRWKEAFGPGFNKYGRRLQKVSYASNRRMELICKMAAADEEIMKIFTDIILGTDDYKTIWRRMLKRFPVGLIKSIFK